MAGGAAVVVSHVVSVLRSVTLLECCVAVLEFAPVRVVQKERNVLKE